MLMATLRSKIKGIILLTLAAFVGLIFFNWGMNKGSQGPSSARGGAIGKVNGEEISYDTYQRTRQNIVANFEARSGHRAESADLDAIEDETWLTLIQDAVLRQQIDRYHIRVSDAEIMEVLRTNPPLFLQQHPDFLNADGQFDRIRYSRALADPAFNWLPVEQYIRAALPTDKVQNYVGLNARVTSTEVRERFRATNERRRVRFVQSTVAGAQLPEGAVDEADLESYFRAHPDEFRVGRQAVLDVVRISKEPSAQDSSEAREDLADIRQIILSGGDFADNAKTWSDDDRSADAGGDLGFLAPGDMPIAFEEIAFSTAVGEVSDVFESPFGFHILKVEEKKTENGTELVRVRHILLKVEASNSTLRNARSRMDDFLSEVEMGGAFETVAADLGYDVETTPPFGRTGLIPGLGLLRGAQRFAFTNEPGAVTVEPIEDERSLYAFRLAERREPRVPPLEEVRDRVEAIVTELERREVARGLLEAAIDESDGSIDSIAKQLGARADTTEAFSRASFVPGIGRRNAFIATAFSLAPGERSGLVESDRGFYVMELVEQIPLDEAAFVEQQDQIRRQLMGEKRQNMISAWLENLIIEAEIIDFRSGEGVVWEPDPSALVYFGEGPPA